MDTYNEMYECLGHYNNIIYNTIDLPHTLIGDIGSKKSRSLESQPLNVLY